MPQGGGYTPPIFLLFSKLSYQVSCCLIYSLCLQFIMNDLFHKLENIIETYSLNNTVLCLHTSFSRLSRLIPNPDIFIDIFNAYGSTLIVPAHSYANRVFYIPKLDIRQNGDDIQPENTNSPQPFTGVIDPEDISPEMGIIARRIAERDTSYIGFHPENAFAGFGPEAKRIIRAQTPWNVYAPYDILMDNKQAKIVLIDVDLSKATPVHYAEMKAGRNLFIRWYKDINHKVKPMRVGGCSDGFERCRPYLKDLESLCHTDSATWRIYPFRPFIDRLTDIIRDKPEVTRCGKSECSRCRNMISGGPYFSFPPLSLSL